MVLALQAQIILVRPEHDPKMVQTQGPFIHSFSQPNCNDSTKDILKERNSAQDIAGQTINQDDWLLSQ